MKIYITGVRGFIGKLLSKRLKKNGHHLVDNGKIDLRDHKEMYDSVVDADPDIIIHLAARTEVESSFYEQIEFSEINYVGTVNLIEAAKKLKHLKLFLFASTMETYGWQPEPAGGWENAKPFDENTVQNPNAPYSVAKVGGELYLKYIGRTSGLPYCILRQTNAYGRHSNRFFVVEQFITQMLSNHSEVNFGYSKPYRNFIYIDDLIDLYVAILKNYEKAQGNIFCTGPPNAIQIHELADLIAKKLNWNGSINWGRKRVRPGEIYYLNSTHTKAKEVLGWEPKISLDEGLDKTIEIWKRRLSVQS